MTARSSVLNFNSCGTTDLLDPAALAGCLTLSDPAARLYKCGAEHVIARRINDDALQAEPTDLLGEVLAALPPGLEVSDRISRQAAHRFREALPGRLPRAALFPALRFGRAPVDPAAPSRAECDQSLATAGYLVRAYLSEAGSTSPVHKWRPGDRVSRPDLIERVEDDACSMHEERREFDPVEEGYPSFAHMAVAYGLPPRPRVPNGRLIDRVAVDLGMMKKRTNSGVVYVVPDVDSR